MQPPPYTNRDYGIEEIRACKNHRYYGMGLGIVISDDVYPGFPGDVRNARALQREIDIPLFSYGTLLDYAYSVVVHRDYYVHV